MKKLFLILIALTFATTIAFSQEWLSNTTVTGHEIKDGKLIIGFRRETQSNVVLTSFPPQYPAPIIEVWRDIYCASNGVIVLEKTEKAKITPSKTEPEKIEWPK